MVKQLLAKLLISFFLFTSSFMLYAHDISFGYSIDYVFKPNEPQDIVNNYFFTITANCKIKSTDESNDVHGKMLNGKGSLNHNELNLGEELTLTIHNEDTLHIVAPPGAKVRLTNLGLHDVNAICFPA